MNCEYFSNIDYLPRTVNHLENWSDTFIYSTDYYLRNRREFTRLSRKYSDMVHSSLLAPVQIRKNIYGNGLFALEDIRKKTFIGEYSGYLQTGQGDRYSWDYPDIDGYENLEISALKGGNELRFINHSFTPNCYAEHFPLDGIYVIIILAKKTIKTGEEFFLDYGDNYWLDEEREIIIEKK